MDASTKAAGTMRQTARGLASFFTNSATGDAPVAPSLTSVSTAWGERSYTTHVCPLRMRRRTMLPPIRPRPIIPNCMALSLIHQKNTKSTKDSSVFAFRRAPSRWPRSTF